MRAIVGIVCSASLALALGGFVLSGASCGGQLTENYLDDAGVYHTSDGALLVPASACAGWDASHAADPDPTCQIYGGDDPACDAWLSLSVPPNLPIDSTTCTSSNDAGSLVCGKLWADRFSSEYTTKCPKDDARQTSAPLCSAWLDQFVVGHRALGACTWTGLGDNFVCTPMPSQCSESMIPIEADDGGVGCAFPCTP
jgi:hypothetical protein